MSEAPLDSPSVPPDQPIVLKELDRLYNVGSQVVGEDQKIIIDGRLVKISDNGRDSELRDGVTGFTHSVIPGCSMQFIIERRTVIPPIDPEETKTDDESPDVCNTSEIYTIELMDDGSYLITTKHSLYLLTGTHTRNNKLVDDSGNQILEAQKATAKQVTDSLDNK